MVPVRARRDDAVVSALGSRDFLPLSLSRKPVHSVVALNTRRELQHTCKLLCSGVAFASRLLVLTGLRAPYNNFAFRKPVMTSSRRAHPLRHSFELVDLSGRFSL
jgi:hypothetical protein